ISERDNELRMHNIQLEKKAIHDHLTGLTNRIGFEESLSLAIDECKNSNNQHVLCYMDLDKFKTINDTCGHSAGDELLIEISSLFKDKIRSKSDTLARIGGDEFALILKDCSVDKATIIAQLICDSVKDYRFNWDGKQYSIGVSIGIIPLDSSSASLKDVITKADVACYAAKEKGRGQVQVITIDDNESGKTTRRANITSLIEEAIKNDKFELFCQAISPLKNQRNIESNCEISLRLLDPDGDYYESSSIIESAKRHNLATDIDKWVIENTFRLLSNNNPLLNSINICTINLSEHSIITNEFSAFINERINHYHIDPKRICFEIAESSTIGILRKVKQFIDEIHALGCFFSLDNFDCGSLSLEYLRHMNVDFLKVEGVLLKKSTTDKISLSIIKAINEIAHSLNMMTIASSVETNDVLENINKLDFDFVQGHIIDKPALLWKSGF
ncbi:MAG: EAL domain-containing protein, partial [Gammaproteobacteria bacterium]|nr:EAL domain-containing protein [Gammaproteobacteria bacterium]